MAMTEQKIPKKSKNFSIICIFHPRASTNAREFFLKKYVTPPPLVVKEIYRRKFISETVMPEQTMQLPMLNFRAGMLPETLDEKTRTVEVVWTTGARGLRQGNWGSFYEELAIEPENIRLDRFIGAVVLDQHRHDSIRNTLGVIDRANPVKSSNGKVKEWRALARFTKDAIDILEKIRDGFLRHVSVGYLVDRYQELEERQNNLPIFRAVDWSPAELSFVTVPFDAKASVRSEELKSNCIIIPFNRSHAMPEPVESAPVAAPAPEATAPVTRQAEPTPAPRQEPLPGVDRAAIEAEVRARTIANLDAVRQAAQVMGYTGEDLTRFERMLAENKTVDAVREAMVSNAARRQPKIDNTSAKVTVGTNLQVDGVERGISEVLLARALPTNYSAKLTDAGRRFQRDSVLRMAERLLEAHGFNTDGMNKQRVISEACRFRSGTHATSDFFWLFESAVDRVLKDEFNKVRLTYSPLAQNVELPDFRPSSYVVVGDNFTLKEQAENEEITYGTFTADGRSFSLSTFSRGIVWSRKMMINDDLSVLSRLPAMVTRAGDKLRAKMVWGMILGDGAKIGGNGVIMSDGNPLFAPVHGNLASSGGAINKQTVAAARKAIRKQKAFGGETEDDTLDLEPRFLIVGPEKEQEANEFLAANFVAVNQTDAAAINLTRSLTLIVENRITNNAWFIASPDIDGIITATLQGQQGMYLDTDQDFETDGFKLKGRMEFGVHMARWEGWYKNPGA